MRLLIRSDFFIAMYNNRLKSSCSKILRAGTETKTFISSEHGLNAVFLLILLNLIFSLCNFCVLIFAYFFKVIYPNILKYNHIVFLLMKKNVPPFLNGELEKTTWIYSQVYYFIIHCLIQKKNTHIKKRITESFLRRCESAS